MPMHILNIDHQPTHDLLHDLTKITSNNSHDVQRKKGIDLKEEREKKKLEKKTQRMNMYGDVTSWQVGHSTASHSWSPENTPIGMYGQESSKKNIH